MKIETLIILLDNKTKIQFPSLQYFSIILNHHYIKIKKLKYQIFDNFFKVDVIPLGGLISSTSINNNK